MARDATDLMAGKTVLVTGGTGGIGKATAAGLSPCVPEWASLATTAAEPIAEPPEVARRP